jgi:hypothetical protein
MSDSDASSLTTRERAQELASLLVKGITKQERDSVVGWLQSLRSIAETRGSFVDKSQRALKETLSADVVWPVVKVIGSEIKRHAWDERSTATKFAGGAALSALALGGSSGAGIAALGAAVAVPIWIVFASGGSFAGVLVDEIKKATGDLGEDEKIARPQDDAAKRVARKKRPALTVDVAYQILDLGADATEIDILDAYLRLIKRVHPDAGGSNYLTAQLNLARDCALQHIRDQA